jgi:hypothetical protein
MATGELLTGLVRQLRRRCGDEPTDGELLSFVLTAPPLDECRFVG